MTKQWPNQIQIVAYTNRLMGSKYKHIWQLAWAKISAIGFPRAPLLDTVMIAPNLEKTKKAKAIDSVMIFIRRSFMNHAL